MNSPSPVSDGVVLQTSKLRGVLVELYQNSTGFTVKVVHPEKGTRRTRNINNYKSAVERYYKELGGIL